MLTWDDFIGLHDHMTSFAVCMTARSRLERVFDVLTVSGDKTVSTDQSERSQILLNRRHEAERDSGVVST